MYVCVIFVVFTDCESCTRPISTHPGSMEAGECVEGVGRVSSYAVSRWSRSPGRCGFRAVFEWGGVFRDFFFRLLFFFERPRPAASLRPPCLIYLSTSIPGATWIRNIKKLYTSILKIKFEYISGLSDIYQKTTRATMSVRDYCTCQKNTWPQHQKQQIQLMHGTTSIFKLQRRGRAP